ncbi:hypothetical protein N7492_010705 [Penicillium capsulatum]|uniref:Uncharacterized protein n=1 Tax=Penicillium capsulatum TaxID=69766 RepID=A0A9W9HPN8_9EURO|nr:hypothetical protein N7492_010705 [Penicillium capsulatum]
MGTGISMWRCARFTSAPNLQDTKHLNGWIRLELVSCHRGDPEKRGDANPPSSSLQAVARIESSAPPNGRVPSPRSPRLREGDDDPGTARVAFVRAPATKSRETWLRLVESGDGIASSGLSLPPRFWIDYSRANKVI